MLRLHLSRELFSTYLDIAFYQNFSFACLTRKIRQKQLVLTFLFVLGGAELLTQSSAVICIPTVRLTRPWDRVSGWVPTTVPAVPFILQVSVQQGWTYASRGHKHPNCRGYTV